MFPFRPSAQEHEQLMHDLGPLPLRGKAWPTWVKVVAVFILALIGLQIVQVAGSPAGKGISPWVAASILVCYCGLVVLARFMLVSETTISADGISQTWLGKRQVSWENLQFARFVPLPASKRLICFQSRGRPVVFQAGTRELQIAFARISLVYRRRT